MLTTQVLVLNRFFIPVSVTSLKRAFILLYCGSAKAVSEDYETFDFNSWADVSIAREEDCVRTVTSIIKAPRVIILIRYEGYFKKQPKFNRINIFRRDNSICQYCRKTFLKQELTIDHVIPKSHGGKSVWENVVCSCAKCNRKKGGKTPEQANMKILNKPVKPKWGPFSNVFIKAVRYKEWEPFMNFVDVSYWNVELEN